MNFHGFKGITVTTLESQEPFFLVFGGQETMILPQNPVAIPSDHPVTEIPDETGNTKAYSGSHSISTQSSCDAKSGCAAFINLSGLEKLHRVQPGRRNTILGQ